MAYLICKVSEFTQNGKVKLEIISGDEISILNAIDAGEILKTTFIESSNIKLETNSQNDETPVEANIKFNYRKTY